MGCFIYRLRVGWFCFFYFFYLIELLVLSSFTIFGHRCVGGAGGGGAQAGGSHLRLTAAVQK